LTALPERILIVLLGAIGDVVRAMPLALRVRRGFPAARIAWAVEPTSAPLLAGHPAIDEAIVFRRDRGAAAFLPFLREIRRRRFDLVLDLQRHLKSGVTSFASGASRRIGFHRSDTKEANWLFATEHVPPQRRWSSKLRQYLAFADHLGLPEAPVEFGFAPTSDECRRAGALLEGVRRPFLAAFVGSTWPSRFWWPEATAEVLARLAAEAGLEAVLVGGPGEEAFAGEVGERLPATVRARNLVGRTTLREAAAVMAEAAVAFGPDSGPMHLAAAVGTPVVSLWGATSPARSAPSGFEDLALVGAVACHPCYLRRCPVGRLCMREIHPADVVERIRLALQRKAA
jgi:lipopolysaccharide heptosyltransferase II